MKELYKKVFDIPVLTEFKLMDGGEKVSICGLVLSYHHRQDCCENVYADFSVLEYHKDKMPYQVKEISICVVEEMGFILKLKDDYSIELKLLINCYNEQNGYYSDNLDLIVDDNGVIIKYNLREENCIQDMIY